MYFVTREVLRKINDGDGNVVCFLSRRGLSILAVLGSGSVAMSSHHVVGDTDMCLLYLRLEEAKNHHFLAMSIFISSILGYEQTAKS